MEKKNYYKHFLLYQEPANYLSQAVAHHIKQKYSEDLNLIEQVHPDTN